MAWKYVGVSMLCLLVTSCGNASHSRPHDAGAGGTGPQPTSCSADASACTLPPTPGNEPPNKNGTTTVMAISKLYLGDTDRWGTPDPDAWKSYGYNLDGLISSGTDTKHCAPQPGANAADVMTDGAGGIDNSFGENVLPILQALGPGDPIPVQQAIADGRFTLLFRIDNFLDSQQEPNQNGVTGAIYQGTDKGSVAVFDGSDVWPVTYDSVVGGDLNAPKVTLSGSYVSGGVWVGRSKADLVLPVVTPDAATQLRIQRAVVTMRIDGVGTSAITADGVIAGVIDPDALVSAAKTLASAYDSSLCSGADFQSIAQEIRATADIMSDESNGDPGVTCDAISIGIGFEATGARFGPVAPPAPPPSDPCAP